MATNAPRHYRLTDLETDLPLMLWPNEEGEIIVQIGRARPFVSVMEPLRFSAFVMDEMWKATPVEAVQYHYAMTNGEWHDDHRSSKETI